MWKLRSAKAIRIDRHESPKNNCIHQDFCYIQIGLEIEEDETAYLLKSPANREHLLKAMENVAHIRNLVAVDLDEN